MKNIFPIFLFVIVSGCSYLGFSDNIEPLNSENKQTAEEMEILNRIDPTPKTKAVLSYLKNQNPTVYAHFLKQPENFIEVVEGSFYSNVSSPDGKYLVSKFYPGGHFEELVTYDVLFNDGVSQLITITVGKTSKVIEEYDGRSDLYNVTFEQDNIKYFLEGTARCVKYSDLNNFNKSSSIKCNSIDPKALKLELNDGLYSLFSRYPSKGGMEANQETYEAVAFRYKVAPKQILTCFITSSKRLYDSDVNYKNELNNLYSTKICSGSQGVLLGPFDSQEAMIKAFEDGERYGYSLGPWYHEDTFNCKNNICK